MRYCGSRGSLHTVFMGKCLNVSSSIVALNLCCSQNFNMKKEFFIKKKKNKNLNNNSRNLFFYKYIYFFNFLTNTFFAFKFFILHIYLLQLIM